MNIINSYLLYNEQEQVSKTTADWNPEQKKLDPWWKKANGKEILGKTVHGNMNMEHGNGKILAGLTGHKEKERKCTGWFRDLQYLFREKTSHGWFTRVLVFFSPLDNDDDIVQLLFFSPGYISW